MPSQQNPNVYTALEPGNESALGHAVNFTIGQTTNLYQLSSFVLFLFLLAISGAAIFQVLRGLATRVGTFGEPSDTALTKSKKIINNALLYLLLSFGLVLLMLAVNPDVVTGNVNWSGIVVNRSQGTGGTAGTSGTTGTPGTTGQTNSNYAARLASHNATVARLAPSNIHTNRNDVPCTEAQFRQTNPECTSLAYLPEETIQMLLRLNSACKQYNSACTLVISGATEPGHAINGSHGENRRGVDLRLRKLQSGASDQNDPLYAYLKTVGRSDGSTGSCYQKIVWNGWSYCDEKPRSNATWNNHFHVD